MLIPADITGLNPNETVDYTEEDAIELLKNSTTFDQFVSDALNDFEQFSRSKAEDNAKN
jgi:hypothetical protein